MAGPGARDGRGSLERQRPRLHHPDWRPLDPANLTRRFHRFLDRSGRAPAHPLPRTTATALHRHPAPETRLRNVLTEPVMQR